MESHGLIPYFIDPFQPHHRDPQKHKAFKDNLPVSSGSKSDLELPCRANL